MICQSFAVALLLVAATTSARLSAVGRDGRPSTPRRQNVPGQLPQFGNGYAAQFVNHSTFYLGGVFNGRKTHSTRAGLPGYGRVFLKCSLDAATGWWDDMDTYPFKLNQSTATITLTGGCSLPQPGGALNITFTQQWYSPRTERHAQVVVDLQVSGPAHPLNTLELEDLDLPVTAVNFPHVQLLAHHSMNGSETFKLSTVTSEEPESSLTNVTVIRTKTPSTVQIPSSVHLTQFVGCSLDDHHGTDEVAEKFTRHLQSPAALQQSHQTAWAELWSRGIETDSIASGAIDASYYAILISVREDWPYNTAPGGLSTDGYNGHSFWDESTWVHPNLQLFHPDIAVGSGFRYRFNRLPGARINARTTLNQSHGAAFPWESAFTGQDVCPAPLFAHTEIHITADVVNAVRMYWHLSHNMRFLTEAWPTLNETAQFWVDRTTVLQQMEIHGEDADFAVNLNNVTGPDEYHLGNNSAYTNYAVQTAVNFTLEAALILGIPIQTLPRWKALVKVASNMTIPFNATADYHPEYEGYQGQMVKQADVILLNYPLGRPQRQSTTRNDLNYYANRTVPNKSGASTMTWTMFSVGYLSIGNKLKGDSYFYEGYVTNCFPPYWQWYQALGHQGNDNFISGAGGFLQNLWAGYGGVRVVTTGGLRGGGISIDLTQMQLPPGATFMKLKGVHVQGGRFDLHYSKNHSLTQYHSDAPLLTVRLSGVDPHMSGDAKWCLVHHGGEECLRSVGDAERILGRGVLTLRRSD